MASVGPARRRAVWSVTRLAAKCGDIGRVALRAAAENGSSCDKNVCACSDRKSCGLRRDAAIHFERDIAPGLSDSLRRCFDFLQLAVDEFLAAKPGIDRHDEHKIDKIEEVVDHIDRRARIEHDSGTLAE